jgi:DNA end-binding protein Ku
MVSIPVELYTGTVESDISFNQLHDECKSRIKYVKWCPVHERAVEQEEIVKGYEYSKGRYVILEEEDLENLPVPSKHTVEVTKFVPAGSIDPVFFDRSYTIEPDEQGLKPYALFLKALEEKGMVGVGKFSIRQKEHICVLRPVKGTLVLETLHYADEVRVDLNKALPDVSINDQEMQMANTLIDLLKGDFDAKEYQDEYRKALMERIEAKAQGQEIVEAAAAPETKIVDLMEALRASVEQAKKEGERVAG